MKYLLILIVLFGCGERVYHASNKNAYTVSKQFVVMTVKTPSTAKFPIYKDADVRVTVLADRKFVVRAYVDAQNLFGAMIRTKYVCELQYKFGDTWELIELTFDK